MLNFEIEIANNNVKIFNLCNRDISVNDILHRKIINQLSFHRE